MNVVMLYLPALFSDLSCSLQTPLARPWKHPETPRTKTLEGGTRFFVIAHLRAILHAAFTPSVPETAEAILS